MRHLKRPALLGLLLLACLLLAGCRMDSTVEELFTLPRLPTEYTTLSRQLDQLLSEGYEYMAPTSGRNIQSLQMVDIDGDGQDEALAFFRLSNGEKPLKIYVFHSREDSYELTSIIEEEHEIDMDCHFCNKRRHFTEQDLRQLLEHASNRRKA